MTRHIAFIALFGLLLVACQFTVVPPSIEDNGYPLNEPIALSVGESVTLTDDVLGSSVELTFVGAVEDSRCPDSRKSDVMCAWSGAVKVEMLATVAGESETFALTGITDYDGVVEGSIESETDSTMWYFAGYHFLLEKVLPYPGVERPQPEEYIVTTSVRRAPEPLPTPTETAASIEHLIDESGLPLLCVSEMAITKWAAGETESQPALLTPPLAAGSLSDVETANEICTLVFGDEWRVADTGDIDGMWSIALPADGPYWVWDDIANRIVEH